MTSFLNTSWNLKVETVSMESHSAGTSQSFQAIESAGERARRANARLGFCGKIIELQTLENQVAVVFLVVFFALKSSKSVSAPHLDFGTEDQVECGCQAHGALEKGSCEQQHHRPPTKPPFSCLLCS